mmetsp:Transcript_19543/g.44363  ORF Transcript_19543/g.44363 Transcript_19543/m.44363 type:complete len:208 (-) Transcript_19543:1135-1758(-)
MRPGDSARVEPEVARLGHPESDAVVLPAVPPRHQLNRCIRRALGVVGRVTEARREIGGQVKHQEALQRTALLSPPSVAAVARFAFSCLLAGRPQCLVRPTPHRRLLLFASSAGPSVGAPERPREGGASEVLEGSRAVFQADLGADLAEGFEVARPGALVEQLHILKRRLARLDHSPRLLHQGFKLGGPAPEPLRGLVQRPGLFERLH